MAEFTDGSRRDVTWLTKFDSNDAGVVAVTPDGARHRSPVGRDGRAGVVPDGGRGRGRSPCRLTNRVDPARLAAKNNFIDEHVFAKLAALRIEPSDLCDGRRVPAPGLPRHDRHAADAGRGAGVPGRPDSRQAGEAHRRAARAAGVRRLLDAHLGDLFQNRKERDHDVRGTKGVRAIHDWLRKQVAANRPWDEIARDVLTATGTTTDNPAVGYYIVTVGEQREAEKSEVAASVAQAFLGTRIGCAQCHNHPLEKYTQDDYYHFAGFFSRVRLERKDPKTGPTVSEGRRTRTRTRTRSRSASRSRGPASS